MKGKALCRFEIEKIRHAGRRFHLSGEKKPEFMIAPVAGARRHFELKEITVFDAAGTQELFHFRLGRQSESTDLTGVHVHMPYGKGERFCRLGCRTDQSRSWQITPRRTSGRHLRIGTVGKYVGELLKALDQGRL